ncbi:Multidrug resistance-associated protein 1 [Podila humilis]|nr:Multidrug resistance-associated protein 1 [Podila humilis]
MDITGGKHRPPVDHRDPTLQAVVDFVMAHGAHYALLGVPALIATVVFVGRIVFLHRNGLAHSYGRTGSIYWPSQLLLVATGISLMLLSSNLLSIPYSALLDGLLSSVNWMFFATLAAIFLNANEHKYTVRASDYLLTYYTVILATSSFSLYIIAGPNNDHSLVDPPPPSAYKSETFRYLLFATVFTAVAFVFEAFPRTNTEVQRISRSRAQLSAWDQANLFSRLTFHYATPLMRLGAKKPLTATDIDSQTPKELSTQGNHGLIAKTWLRRLASRGYYSNGTPLAPSQLGNKKLRDPPTLLSTVLLAHRSQIIPTMAVRITSFVLLYVPPFLFVYLLRFFADYTEAVKNDTPLPPLSRGLAIAVGMFVSSLVSGILLAQSSRQCANMAIGARAGLIGMIYRKALRLSPVSRQKSTLGEVTNHMAVDAEVWMQASNLLPIAITIPIELAIATVLLYNVLGWSVFAGLSIFVVVFPIQTLLTAAMNKAQRTKLEVMDSRMRVMTEMLSNMKTVKLNSLELMFTEKIDEHRTDELKAQKSQSVSRSFLEIVFSSVNLLITLATFAVYATVGGPNFTPGPITPVVIFVGLTVFARLSLQLGLITLSISHLIALKNANQRIEKFLLQEEIDTSSVGHFSRQVPSSAHHAEGNYPAIDIQDGTFSWAAASSASNGSAAAPRSRTETAATLVDVEREPLLSNPSATIAPSQPTLRDIDLHIYDGKLAAVIGRIGQGKSSLLSAIVGEMYKDHGTVAVYGDVAYVPHQPWIISGTVRENITIGKTFDQARYDQIIYAAGLQTDLDAFTDGDNTELGSRGVTLSVGQKQRIALARAAYQDADIYLLDDPLSSVDVHVDNHLWHNMIGPNGLLKHKTRVFVTHGIHHLHEVDQIIVMKDGAVAENGEYQELMDAKHLFHALMNEFDNAEHRARRRADKSPVRNVQDHATVVNMDGGADAAKKEAKASGLVQPEQMASGRVTWATYWVYAKAIGVYNLVLCILLYIFVAFLQIATNVWLARWTADTERGKAKTVEHYLTGYSIFVGVFLVVDLIVHYIANVTCGIRGAKNLHDRMLARVLRFPISFFDVTPVGRVINRFSSDVSAVDSQLPNELPGLLSFSTTVLGIVVVIAYSTPLFLIAVPPLAIAFFLLQHYYIKTSGALKRLYSVSKGPLYEHFAESLAGVTTLRASRNVETLFEQKNEILSDTVAHRADYFMLTNRWLTVRLQLLTSSSVFIVAALAVLNADRLNTSLVGLALTYVLSLANVSNVLVRTSSEVQNLMVNVERIEEYADRYPVEAHLKTEKEQKLPLGWPNFGSLAFKGYSARYREGLPNVLEDINFFHKAHQNLGIVGRTGSGKSSLAMAVFRMFEPSDSFWSIASDPVMGHHLMDPEFMLNKDGGRIEIDGIDIAKAGIRDLRDRLAIMPQEVTIFEGNIRDNIDPYHEFTERELWECLEKVHLKEYVETLPDDMLWPLPPNGENFSAGQKALIGLARALLRPANILFMDEATANVDLETEDLIMKAVRKHFANVTVVTIAHRVKTVMDYDQILVLDEGKVVEYGPPQELLALKEESAFYRLAKEAGEVE